ncbi:MAG: hypothetical protein J6B75_02200 [Ruminococcus sp.]|nr:hypothetical protein [Ruminococcus sp.]
MEANDKITMETVQAAELEAVEEEKPYKFRKLLSKDVFLMTKIISKIGINNFSECLEKDSVKSAIKKIADKGEEEKDNDNAFTLIGITVSMEIADVVFSNLDKCQNDIYKLLSQTSNVKFSEFENMDAVVFLEMVVDFIKKEEFKDFFRVASKLLK